MVEKFTGRILREWSVMICGMYQLLRWMMVCESISQGDGIGFDSPKGANYN